MPCSDVLQWGIFDRETVKTNEEFFSSLQKWFSLNKYNSKSDTYQAAAKAGINIPTEIGVIPMNLDGTYGESHNNNYSEALSDILFQEEWYKKEFYRDNIQASSVIVNAWRDCQLYERTPLFGQALYQDNADDDENEEIVIKIKINYLDPNKPDKVIVDQKAIKEELDNGIPGYKLVEFKRTQLNPAVPFSFKIIRDKSVRPRGGYFMIRTSHPNYSCEIKLAPLPNFIPIEFVDEYSNPSKKKELTARGQKDATLPLRNLKTKNILLNIEAEFHVWGPNAGTCDLRLYCDDEMIEKKGVSITNQNILETISLPNIAWSPGIERNVSARIENWGFDTEPQRWYVNIVCHY